MLKDDFPELFEAWKAAGGNEEESFWSYLLAIGALPVSQLELDAMTDNVKSHVQELALIAQRIPK